MPFFDSLIYLEYLTVKEEKYFSEMPALEHDGRGAHVYNFVVCAWKHL
jgi:hypothetical protein